MKKTKQPPIISYEVLRDQYQNAHVYNPQEGDIWRNIDYSRVDKSDPSFKQSTLGMGEGKKSTVLEVLTKYKDALEEIENSMLDFVQFQFLQDPPVYIAKTKDIKTDIEYFTGKTFFPLKGGKRKEVKIYVGKAKDFKDTRDKAAISLAGIKMRNTLVRRLKDGSL